MTLLSQRSTAPEIGESGFTVMETLIAITILAIAMVGLLGAALGGMNALASARKRSAFIEVLNAEMEQLRSVAYDSVAVLSTDPNFDVAYPAGHFEGRDANVVTPGSTSATPSAAISVVSTSPVKGVVLPYTVKRYVTWTDASGGVTHVFKRLDITVTWTEKAQTKRTTRLTSLLYPGGLGPATTSPDQNPNPGTIALSPASGLKAGQSVTFTDSGASHPNGYALSYSWDFGDGSVAAGGSSISHVYAAPGTYSAQVTVTDGHGAGAIATISVSVGPVTTPAAPTAAFTADFTSGVAPLTVNLDASGSTDPNGDGLQFSWGFGDGTAAATGVNVTHVFAAPGTFTVTLTATDPGGQTGTTTRTITTTPLNCSIGDASFKNPSTASLVNDVKATNGVPVNASFQFTVTTNTGCSNVSAQLFYADGTAFTTSLTILSTTNGVRTWQAAGAASKAFSVGTGQAAQAFDAGGATFTYSYSVHT